MTADSDAERDLPRRICAGDKNALADFFGAHREKLRKMVQLRLDRRLQGRVDPSDVIQDAYIEACAGCRSSPPSPR